MSEGEDASGKGSNLTAVEAISARLAEVTRLAEKLDAKLCEAGARTRPVPMSSSTMSSNSSLFSSTSTVAPTATSTSKPISSGTSTFAASSTSTTPSTSLSVSTVLQQSKSISTTSSATPSTTESVTPWSSPATAILVTSTPVSANGTIATSDRVDRILSPVLETSTVQKNVMKDTRGTNGETHEGLDADDISGDEKEEDQATEDAFEKSCDDSIADDSNMDGYVTATECSITPTARSRSESFVTSPECEDLAAPATMTCDTWWNIEDPKFTTAHPAIASSAIKQEETSTVPRIEKKDSSMDISKPEVRETNGEKQVEKVVSLEKRVEEKSGKIVKEVTETTTLRVEHDTRLGIASYKVISNTLQDHRENVDVKEMKNLERVVAPDVYEKTNGLHCDTDFGAKTESYSLRNELSTKTNDIERSTKFTKICEITEEEKPRVASKETSKDITLTLKEYTRHHEDSGIEMSPTKKDENPEGQDFLEKARKVSSIEASSMNGEKNCCCNCNCSHETACFDRYSMQQTFIDENHRLSLSNAS